MTLRVFAVAAVLAATTSACLAGEIRKGATVQVKANSIWFQDVEEFARWQTLKKGGDPKVLGGSAKQAGRLAVHPATDREASRACAQDKPCRSRNDDRGPPAGQPMAARYRRD